MNTYFDVIHVDQLLTTFLIIRYQKKNIEYNRRVHQKFLDFKKANDLIRIEVWNNILIEFGMPKKLVRIIKSCLVFRS
jgi:hypothetical protein